MSSRRYGTPIRVPATDQPGEPSVADHHPKLRRTKRGAHGAWELCDTQLCLVAVHERGPADTLLVLDPTYVIHTCVESDHLAACFRTTSLCNMRRRCPPQRNGDTKERSLDKKSPVQRYKMSRLECLVYLQR